MAAVERRELVANNRLAVAPDPDLAAVAVAPEHPDGDRARETLHQPQVIGRAPPWGERDEQMRMVGRGLVFQAVPVAEVAVLIGVERLHDALPRLEVLVGHPPHRCRRMQLRWRPMFSFCSPERLRSAGVWIAPPATITARDRIVTLWPSTVFASTPRAVPPSTITCLTRLRTINRAPAEWASASHVFTTDCFAPTLQPSPQYPHSRPWAQ
jgi:hypothetical protein